MKRAIVILTDGFEEMEAVIPIDILRRSGVEVTVFGLPGATVTGSHGIAMAADACDDGTLGGDFDLVLLPGGMPGSETLAADGRVLALLRRQHAAGRLIAAICAAPLALHAAGLLAGVEATSHPSVRERLPGAIYREARVVDAGTVITSRGPGTAFEFALRLVRRLAGFAASRDLARAMLVEE